jgi:hypothetical protein
MSEQSNPLDSVTEIDLEVQSVTSEALVRWSRGESFADMARVEPIRRVLDYLVSADIVGADSPDMPPDMQPAVGEFNANWQEQLTSMTAEERDDLAAHMLEGLVRLSTEGRIEGIET